MPSVGEEREWEGEGTEGRGRVIGGERIIQCLETNRRAVGLTVRLYLKRYPWLFIFV